MRRKPKHSPSRRVQAATVQQGVTGGFAPSWGGSNTSIYPIVEDTKQRGWRPQLDRDNAALITRYRHRAMLSDARYVYGGVGQVSGAIRDKANFVVGDAWIPRYNGASESFRKAFNEVIVGRWIRNCDVRGGAYNWQTNVKLACEALDRDGEIFILTTVSEFGSPRLQFLESHRIGGDSFGDNKVPKEANSKWTGFRICNGIVYDEVMRSVAYNILPADEPYIVNKTPWNLVDATSVIHVIDPQWFSQNRGIPTICNGILDWYDIGEIRDAQKVKVKATSRITLIENNDTGKPDLTKNAMSVRDSADISKIETNSRLIENGLIRYFKAQSGNTLQTFAADTPGSTWESFVKHIERSAHRGMDWPVEMHDMGSVGGAGVRAVVGQVRRSVINRRSALWNPMLSAVLFAVSYYIKVRKELPMVGDWASIEFTQPADFSVDLGRDSQNRRQDVAMGLRGVDDVLAEEGEGDIEAVFERRAKVYNLREKVAKRFGVPPEAIYNPGAASVQAAATSEGEATVWQQQQAQAEPNQDPNQ